jgi:hypothetical protein
MIDPDYLEALRELDAEFPGMSWILPTGENLWEKYPTITIPTNSTLDSLQHYKWKQLHE